MAEKAAANGSGSDVFVATYHDTPDRRLERANIVLRRRMVNGVGLWEAQIGGDLVAAPGGPTAVPDEIARRLSALFRHAELVEVARLRTGVADVALLEGGRVVRSYGDEAQALHDGDLPAEPSPGRKAPAVEHVRRYLRAQLAALERHDPLVRVKDDVEAIHDLRVAIRRSRAILRAARGLYDRDWVDALRAELKWFASELAPMRDLDVLIEYLREQNDVEDDLGPLIHQLEIERRRARRRVLTVLQSNRYLKLLDELEAAVSRPPVVAVDTSLPRLARREFRRLERTMRGLGDDASDAALHRARIKAKRLRYAAELASPASGKRMRRLVAAAKELQEVLGTHQDAVVAESRLRGLVDGPESGFAAGRLVERQASRRQRARAQVPKAWRGLERAARKAVA